MAGHGSATGPCGVGDQSIRRPERSGAAFRETVRARRSVDSLVRWVLEWSHVSNIDTIQHRERGSPIAGIVVSVMEGPDRGRRFAAADSISVGTAEANDLVLHDGTVSRHHLELERRGDRIRVRDLDSTNGTYFAGAEVRDFDLRGEGKLRVGSTILRITDGDPTVPEEHPDDRLAGLLGRSEGMRRLMARVQRVAESDVSALILGETGVGKELIAQAIHQLSARSTGPFETIDCGALNHNLIASELFGHERGAFTGADRQHVGIFERADGGTVFLDEIGELPAALQVALLGALERRSLRRLGGKEQIPFNARIVGATNRDLRAAVNRGEFRQDLYYRVAVVLIRPPPLRERPEDIPLLVAHFARLAGQEHRSAEVLTPEVLQTFRSHRWPGNVRELRNAVEAMLALGEPFTPDGAEHPSASGGSTFVFSDARVQAIERFERSFILSLLDHTKGNVSEAARVGQLNRSYLIRLMSKHSIKYRRQVGSGE